MTCSDSQTLLQSQRDAPNNRLLAALPEDEFERITRFLEPIDLPRGQVLHEPGEAIHHVYFPVQSMVSLVSLMKQGLANEIGFAAPKNSVCP